MGKFTAQELREINDALAESVARMLDQGQTEQEREFNSLASAWEAQKKCVQALLGDPPPPWVAVTQARVDAVVAGI